jgi:hypothetical protein
MTMTAIAAIEHEIGATGLLSIRIREGSAHLRAVEGTAVRVHDANGTAEASFEIDRGVGSLALRSGGSRGDGYRRGHSAVLVVEVPIRATVVVESASGDLLADGLLGDQRYRTASGDVTLRDVAGRLAVEVVSGDVDATVVDDAALSVRTVSGDIALRAATILLLRASTTSGDLRIAGRLTGDGPFAIETVSGDSTLALAGDVRVETHTVAGDIRSDLDTRVDGGPGRRVLIVGGGGPTLTVRSMSGDVRLVRPTAVMRPATPPLPEEPGSPEVPDMPYASDIPHGQDPARMAEAPTDAIEAARLSILQALERGELDVAEAGDRLEALDGPEVSTDA